MDPMLGNLRMRSPLNEYRCGKHVCGSNVAPILFQTLPPTMDLKSLGVLLVLFFSGWPLCPGSLFPDGCPNPCSTALAFLYLNIIFCRGQVLVERPTATHFVVERRCGFQCFCTKPQGNIGGTKPLELLVGKKPSRNANFFMFFRQVAFHLHFVIHLGKTGFSCFFTSLW